MGPVTGVAEPEPRLAATTVPRTRGRRFIWAVTPLVVVLTILPMAACTIGLVGFFWADHSAYQRACDARTRVQAGMTLPEVRRAILGVADLEPGSGVAGRTSIYTNVGLGSYEVVLHLDAEGRVTSTDPPQYASD